VTAFVRMCSASSRGRCDGVSTTLQWRHTVSLLHCMLYSSSRCAPCRYGRDDITKQLMLDSLLDDLIGSMTSGADDAGAAAAQAHAIGSILAAVRAYASLTQCPGLAM